MRCTWKLPREKHLEHLLPVQGLVWRKRNNFVDCGWMQAWAPRNMLLRGSSQGGFWGRGALKRWGAWTLGLGSCGVGWRLENIFLELDPRLDWHLHMLTQGRQGRSWDKSASRVGRSLSLVDQLMTAFLPEKECQVTVLIICQLQSGGWQGHFYLQIVVFARLTPPASNWCKQRWCCQMFWCSVATGPWLVNILADPIFALHRLTNISDLECNVVKDPVACVD